MIETITRELLEQFIVLTSRDRPHLLPVVRAAPDHGIGVGVLSDGRARVLRPNSSPAAPTVSIVSDSGSLGPAGFDLRSMRSLLRNTCGVVFVACAPAEAFPGCRRALPRDAIACRRRVRAGRRARSSLREERGRHRNR